MKIANFINIKIQIKHWGQNLNFKYKQTKSK